MVDIFAGTLKNKRLAFFRYGRGLAEISKPFVAWMPMNTDFFGAVGSALPWHGRGQGFNSPQLHHLVHKELRRFRPELFFCREAVTKGTLPPLHSSPFESPGRDVSGACLRRRLS